MDSLPRRMPPTECSVRPLEPGSASHFQTICWLIYQQGHPPTHVSNISVEFAIFYLLSIQIKVFSYVQGSGVRGRGTQITLTHQQPTRSFRSYEHSINRFKLHLLVQLQSKNDKFTRSPQLT